MKIFRVTRQEISKRELKFGDVFVSQTNNYHYIFRDTQNIFCLSNGKMYDLSDFSNAGQYELVGNIYTLSGK